jgi:glycosyltransferase involved in cell wall biosynthesis
VSLSHIALGLLERGHRPHLFAGEASVVNGFAGRGLSASRVPTADTTLAAVRALARELRRRQADCLIVDRPRDLRLGALASLLYPCPLINRYNLSRPRPPRDLLSRLAYLRVALTIFVSHTNAGRALASGRYLARRPYKVIHEGVGPEFRPDDSAAAAFRAEWDLLDREFVLAVGSLTADKRYPFLFDVLSRVCRNAPLLVVCGEGPLKEQLMADARNLGVDVRFVGLVPPEVLRGAYTAARCLVHACEIETFGLSVLEAMACGCPVLAVASGAVPEVLGETGVLTPVNQPEPFAQRLRELLVDSERRRALGTVARRRASEQFSLTRMQREHVEAIESICSATRPEVRLEHVQSAPPGL